MSGLTYKGRSHTSLRVACGLFFGQEEKVILRNLSFVIVFFGAPLVAGSSKRGKASSFGIALVICFIYYSLINASQILGRNSTLIPFVAAWLPNSLFFFVGLILHFRANK